VTFLEATWHRNKGMVELPVIDGFCEQVVVPTATYREKANDPNTQLTGQDNNRNCRGHNRKEKIGFCSKLKTQKNWTAILDRMRSNCLLNKKGQLRFKRRDLGDQQRA
jgi:hypothetical protein